MIYGHPPLNVFNFGYVAGQGYSGETKQSYIRLCRVAYVFGIFMRDNAHSAPRNLLKEFVEIEDIEKIP